MHKRDMLRGNNFLYFCAAEILGLFLTSFPVQCYGAWIEIINKNHNELQLSVINGVRNKLKKELILPKLQAHQTKIITVTFKDIEGKFYFYVKGGLSHWPLIGECGPLSVYQNYKLVFTPRLLGTKCTVLFEGYE
jgi:hypothetical protein